MFQAAAASVGTKSVNLQPETRGGGTADGGAFGTASMIRTTATAEADAFAAWKYSAQRFALTSMVNARFVMNEFGSLDLRSFRRPAFSVSVNTHQVRARAHTPTATQWRFENDHLVWCWRYL